MQSIQSCIVFFGDQPYAARSACYWPWVWWMLPFSIFLDATFTSRQDGWQFFLWEFLVVLIGWLLAESLSFEERPGECRTVSCGSEILSSNELEGWHLSHTISHKARGCHDINCTYTICRLHWIRQLFLENQPIFSVQCPSWSDWHGEGHVHAALRCPICAWSLLALPNSAERCDTSLLVSFCVVSPCFTLCRIF